ncbi:MAG: sulfotransferase [Caulobacterales bacterium]
MSDANQTGEQSARRNSWTPQPRPEWVQRLNEEGACLDLEGVVPLDSQSLRETAMRNTGLSNFGEDGWREPFEVFVKSLQEEAALNMVGRIMTRAELLTWLELRLRVEEEYRLHPEIADEEIKKPLLITGQGRSGTSALQNLLSADPDNGTLMTWEAFYPSPPPEPETYHVDPRIEKAHALITRWYRVSPELQAMHEFGGDIPTEGIHLQVSSFQMPTWMNLMGQVPSFNAYIFGKGSFLPALEWEKRVLRVLQWKKPRRWVMKSPVLYNLLDVMKAYPDVCLVWAHRDPLRSLASAVNMVGALFWQRSDEPFRSGALDNAVDENVVAMEFNMATDWVQQGLIPQEQLLNIHYAEFIKDQMAIVRRIYDKFDIPLTPEGEAAMQKYLDDNRREKRPSHDYAAGAAEWAKVARKPFQRYQDYFSVPNEI